jgi:hypothetical protein
MKIFMRKVCLSDWYVKHYSKVMSCELLRKGRQQRVTSGFSDLRTVGLDDQILSWECWEDDCDDVQDEGGCWENPDGTPKYG